MPSTSCRHTRQSLRKKARETLISRAKSISSTSHYNTRQGLRKMWQISKNFTRKPLQKYERQKGRQSSNCFATLTLPSMLRQGPSANTSTVKPIRRGTPGTANCREFHLYRVPRGPFAVILIYAKFRQVPVLGEGPVCRVLRECGGFYFGATRQRSPYCDTRHTCFMSTATPILVVNEEWFK